MRCTIGAWRPWLLMLLSTSALVCACVQGRPATDTGDPGFPFGPSAVGVQPIAYVQDIKPIFDRDCLNCHSDAQGRRQLFGALLRRHHRGAASWRREQLGRRRLLARRQHVSLLHRRRGDRGDAWCSAGWLSTTERRAASAVPTRFTLTLLGAAAAFSLIAARNWAQNNEMNVQFHGFQDVRGVTVLSPTVDLTQDYTERTNLRVNYGLDTISAASDSCVRCHHDGVNSHRQVFGLSATRKYNDLKLTIGGAYSKENFYRATTGLASVSRDLARGNTTVAGGFSFSLNQPMLHPLPEYENQYQSGGFVSVTQTLTKTHDRAGRLRGLRTSPAIRTIRTSAPTSTARWCSATSRMPGRGRRCPRGCARRCRPPPTPRPTIGGTPTIGR